MKRKSHKRKQDQVMILTPETADGELKQVHILHGLSVLLGVILCLAFGSLIGFSFFQSSEQAKERLEQQKTAIALDENIQKLEQEKAALEQEINTLNEKIQILCDTVNQKTQNEDTLTQELERQFLPSGFPLSKSASMDELTEGDPMCIFTASPGAMVVAAGGGEVLAVNDDAEYGHNVWIDHGNGYITIYRNSGEVKVKQGEKVNAGNTLFLINADNCKLGYQMLLDGTHIDPMTMLEISG